ncbi:Cilia- and flagella-associated protein 299, partial [Geodia barretti]
KTEDFGPYFSGRRKLLPRHSDLSFYNWDTNYSTSNSTANYQVIADSLSGLLFKNKRDRKMVCVDPKAPSPGDNTTCARLSSQRYIQITLFDHITRRKA